MADVKVLAMCLAILGLMSLQAFGSPVESDGKMTGEYSKNWELLNELNIGGRLPVLKYRSKRTGLTVTIGKAESPIVNGYFCLATEAKTRDGLPHTLEHLIFLGSEEYPYKEMLDLSANRCLASRTNAWTDTDHTCYTVYTAGTSGFMNILPIYMDHILFPLLREEDFMTEVHHITAKGEDSGVVYSEMQGVENSPSNIVYFNTVKEIYPGNSSYEIQTGGVLKNLRESTTIEKVREYHKKYYRPENTYLTITGDVDEEEIFKSLEPLELKAEKRMADYPPFVKPFQEMYGNITKDINKKIQFPSDEEEQGHVAFAWRLPYRLIDGVKTMQGMKMLASYLTFTQVSPMMEAFVNTAEPLATDVDVDTYLFAQPAISVDFESVPVAKMVDIEAKFRAVIDGIVEAGPEAFDLDRIHTLIKRTTLAHKKKLENSPHLLIPSPVILDMIYGEGKGDLEKFLHTEQEKEAQFYLDQPAQYWIDLLKETFPVGPRIRVLAYPSKKLNEEIIKNESDRVEKQKTNLGKEGLKKAGEAVANAIKSQILPPQEVLESVPVGDADKIRYRSITSYNHTTKEQPKDFDVMSIPYGFHLDQVNSDFIRYFLFLDLRHLSQEDRPYMVLLTETWLETAQMVNGELQPHKDVIKRRAETALSFYNDLGYKGSSFIPGAQSEMLMFNALTLFDKYVAGIEMLKDSVFNVVFEADRVKSICSQLLNIIPGAKLKAASVVDVLSDNMWFNNQSVIHHSSFLRQKKFLDGVMKQLEEDPQPVLDKLQALVKQIVQPKGAVVYLATDVDKLSAKYGDGAFEIWRDFFPRNDEAFEFKKAEELKEKFMFVQDSTLADPKPEFKHAITAIPGSESCYLKQAVPFEVRDWESKDVAIVRVLLQYLSDQMYNLIRGRGLTYSVSMSSSVTEGRMRVKFTRSSQLSEAYKVFREIIRSYVEGEAKWDEALLDSAQGSQVYAWAAREETVESLSNVAVKSVLRGVWDTKYNRRFVKRIASVTLDEVKEAAQRFLPRFLDPEVSMSTITCGAAEVPMMAEFMNDLGFKMKIIEDIENSVMSN